MAFQVTSGGAIKELGEWRTSAISFSCASCINGKTPAQVLLAQLMVEQDLELHNCGFNGIQSISRYNNPLSFPPPHCFLSGDEGNSITKYTL